MRPCVASHGDFSEPEGLDSVEDHIVVSNSEAPSKTS